MPLAEGEALALGLGCRVGFWLPGRAVFRQN